MNTRFAKLILGSAIVLLGTSGALHASLPASYTHNTRYINSDGTYTYYTSSAEYYVKDTLPNEWYPSWTTTTLQAGAVIIRSGAYWRINRSVLGSSYPNNNCYQGTSGSFTYYRTAPQTRGGQEQWIPNSGASYPTTNSATDTTNQIHADRLSLPAGRPDRFVPHRYNSTIQTRTRDCAGTTYYEKIRCAVVGYGGSIDPNTECSQTDDLTTTDPTYRTD
jgi:hypothetical protein